MSSTSTTFETVRSYSETSYGSPPSTANATAAYSGSSGGTSEFGSVYSGSSGSGVGSPPSTTSATTAYSGGGGGFGSVYSGSSSSGVGSPPSTTSATTAYSGGGGSVGQLSSAPTYGAGTAGTSTERAWEAQNAPRFGWESWLSLVFTVTVIGLWAFALFLSFRRNRGFRVLHILSAMFCCPCYLIYAAAVPRRGR